MWAIIGPLYKNSKMYTEPVCTRRLEISPFYIKIKLQMYGQYKYIKHV